MATFKRDFASQSQIIGSGDSYVTLSGTTESYSSDVDHETNGYEGSQVIVEVDFDTSPTDNVIVNIYGSLDGSNYDDIPVYSQQISNDTDPSQMSIVVKDLLHFRIGVVQTGSTDSHDVRAYVQSWNWSDS